MAKETSRSTVSWCDPLWNSFVNSRATSVRIAIVRSVALVVVAASGGGGNSAAIQDSRRPGAANGQQGARNPPAASSVASKDTSRFGDAGYQSTRTSIL